MLAVGSVKDIQQGQLRRAWVRCRVLGGAEGLAAWLAARGDVHEIQADGEQVGFAHDGDEQSEADLLKSMIAADFRVVAFGSKAKTLEEVFMQVTEGLVQ
jgi:ABC-2 type transport system ATP-binding protein